MRFFILALLLTGCISVAETPLGSGAHQLATTAAFPNNYSGAQIALDDRAAKLCPAGYEKLGEKKTGDDLVWTIRCD